MKKVVALFALLITFVLFTFVAGADTFNGTMVRSNNADPNLFFHDGYYYLTQTGTSRIAVFKSKTLEGLDSLTLSSNISYTAYLNGTVYDPAVTELFGSGATINGTWSPEIHYFSEEQFPGNSGWYMFLGLRKNTGDSSMVRMVVLKSTTGSPKGPYGHPTKGTKNYSQPLLDKNGNIWNEWGCGQTILTIPEGPYKGTYTMWVAEEGRGSAYGGKYGDFYQKIMIAKMKSPWQLASAPGIVTTPTQSWEYAGASTTHPRVVEGATPVYGKNGEIFITYSGSGYWSDYGLGQLTWNGGDPLKTSSWVKLPVANGNPIFSAVKAKNLRGAGHASFLTDTDGNGFICYHAYAYDPETGTKASSRDAYIEPYYIDYTKWNGVSYGVIKIGLNKNGIPADTASTVNFATDGEYLSSPTLTAKDGKAITLTMSESGAKGYLIYKSTDGKVFNYLTTVDATTYTDSDVNSGDTYYYRAYAYREEEISDVSETVSATAKTTVAPPTLTLTADAESGMIVTVSASTDYDSVTLYRSTDGNSFSLVKTINNVSSGETVEYVDSEVVYGTVLYYYAFGFKDGERSNSSQVVEKKFDQLFAPVIAVKDASCIRVTIEFGGQQLYGKYTVYRSTDGNTFEEIGAVSGAAGYISYYDSTAEAGTKYYYKATGFANPPFASSGYSNVVSVTIVHSEASGDGLAPTCTENGYTAYTYCTNCNAVLSGKEVIPTAGHSYELTEEEIPATTVSAGKTAVYTCAGCGDSYGGEEIPKLEDVFTMAGDANRDGKLTLIDVLRTLKALSGDDADINKANVDMDGDTVITISDVLAILKVYLGI